MQAKKALNRLLTGALIAGATWGLATAQTKSSSPDAASVAATGYDKPPQYILDVMLASSPPIPSVNPTHDAILLVSEQEYPSIARVATPYLRLAGARGGPRNPSKHDTPGGYGITPCARNFDLVRLADGAQTHVALPAGACPGWPLWAADGKRFAFVNLAAEA